MAKLAIVIIAYDDQPDLLALYDLQFQHRVQLLPENLRQGRALHRQAQDVGRAPGHQEAAGLGREPMAGHQETRHPGPLLLQDVDDLGGVDGRSDAVLDDVELGLEPPQSLAPVLAQPLDVMLELQVVKGQHLRLVVLGN